MSGKGRLVTVFIAVALCVRILAQSDSNAGDLAHGFDPGFAAVEILLKRMDKACEVIKSHIQQICENLSFTRLYLGPLVQIGNSAL